jgi:hypothetical protein
VGAADLSTIYVWPDTQRRPARRLARVQVHSGLPLQVARFPCYPNLTDMEGIARG